MQGIEMQAAALSPSKYLSQRNWGKTALSSILLIFVTLSIKAADKPLPVAEGQNPLSGVAHPHFQAEDIFELEVASDPQVSPDGRPAQGLQGRERLGTRV